MNPYLQNYIHLFSDDQATVIKAVKEKKDWILRPLFLPLDFTQKEDENGKKHFYHLEALLDDVICFSSLKSDLQVIQNFRFVKFQTDLMVHSSSFPYAFIQYDFRKIDQKGYQELLANYYPCLSLEELEIKEDASSNVVEAMKYFMVGEKNEAVLILDAQQLIHDAYYAPVIRQLIVHPSTPEELKELLKGIAKEKGVPYVEVDYAQ